MAEIEQKLRKLLNTIAEEQGYENHNIEVREISTGGASYTSALFSATISAPQREDLHLFAKVANLGQEIRTEMPTKIFDIERIFYTELNKTYEDLQEKHGVPQEHRLVVPKLYGYNPDYLDEIIVLENLTAKGFTCYDRLKSVTWEYASKSVEQLAKLHALSFAYQEENPEEFENTLENIPFQANSSEVKDSFANHFSVFAYEVTKEKHKGRLKRFLQSAEFNENLLSGYKAKSRRVIVHGDYRASNLMHRRRNGKIEVVPLDFQTIHCGCPASDLMYFIFTGSDEQFRKLHYQNLIAHYYAQLRLALQRLHLDTAKVYPRDDFESDLKEVQMFGLIVGVAVLPAVTADLPRADGEVGEGTESKLVVKPSALYEDRFNGIVNDYVRWKLLPID